MHAILQRRRSPPGQHARTSAYWRSLPIVRKTGSGRVRVLATVSYQVGRDERQVSDETSNTEASSRPKAVEGALPLLAQERPSSRKEQLADTLTSRKVSQRDAPSIRHVADPRDSNRLVPRRRALVAAVTVRANPAEYDDAMIKLANASGSRCA